MSDDLSSRALATIEAHTQELGRELFARLERRAPHPLQRKWWEDQILAWAMRDESVKVQMFRFIDVLPMLSTSDAITRHLHEYFEDVRQQLPAAARLAMAIAPPRSLTGRALAIVARRNAQSQARRFIAGTNTVEVLAAATRQRKLKRAFTLDILGEAVISDREADQFLAAYETLLTGLAPTANAWPEIPQIDRAPYGALPRVNLSIKISALDSHFDPIDPDGALRRVGPRLRKLLRLARAQKAFINVDMESYAVKDLTLWLFKQVLREDEFRDFTDVGIVIQAYLQDSLSDLVALREWACERGHPVWVRLVKGAYWDYETILCQQHGWPIPVFARKWETDANYERATRYLLQSHRELRAALGSHNLRSLAHGIATARYLGLPPNSYEIQMLYGMADEEKDLFVSRGQRLRVYMPYGELIPGMAYLVRRLLENTSNDSFLRASIREHVAVEKLLMNPREAGRQPATAAPAATSPVPVPHLRGRSFQNEPLADFSQAAQRQAMQTALANVAQKLGRYSPLWIDGRAVETPERLVSVDPSQIRQVVGTTSLAEVEHVELAVTAARAAWPAWSKRPVRERADLLRKTAARMRDRRFELAAWQVYECGKPWREADGDVAEAIDFCEYYAQGAEDLFQRGGVLVPGEDNRFRYRSRGVAAIIAPWNFPLAILTGMTVAALVTGNTAIMKPSEQSTVNGALLMELFQEAGFPHGVVNFLPGKGEVVGAALVEHPEVALVAFTGSRAVGLAINAKAAEMSAGKHARGVKKVIAELGGKNAILVDDDADLDEAVQGVVKSAFGYQGQKCSACSRAVVLASVYDTFLQRLIEATRSLQLGPAVEPGTQVGPVIDEESRERILRYVELGKKEARLVLALDPSTLALHGTFVGPHIFADVPPTARIAQEEIFGPVLAVIKAENFDEAVKVVNNVDYALTGGIYSRSPAHLERAQEELEVGNLYLNRAITGALVHRQPFGGYKFSGIGSQAGGPDYLLQFVVPRTITENTMRRGFAPAGDAENSH